MCSKECEWSDLCTYYTSLAPARCSSSPSIEAPELYTLASSYVFPSPKRISTPHHTKGICLHSLLGYHAYTPCYPAIGSTLPLCRSRYYFSHSMARRKARSNKCSTGKRRIRGKMTLVAVRLERDFSYCFSLYHLSLHSSLKPICLCFNEREFWP